MTLEAALGCTPTGVGLGLLPGGRGPGVRQPPQQEASDARSTSTAARRPRAPSTSTASPGWTVRTDPPDIACAGHRPARGQHLAGGRRASAPACCARWSGSDADAGRAVVRRLPLQAGHVLPVRPTGRRSRDTLLRAPGPRQPSAATCRSRRTPRAGCRSGGSRTRETRSLEIRDVYAEIRPRIPNVDAEDRHARTPRSVRSTCSASRCPTCSQHLVRAAARVTGAAVAEIHVITSTAQHTLASTGELRRTPGRPRTPTAPRIVRERDRHHVIPDVRRDDRFKDSTFTTSRRGADATPPASWSPGRASRSARCASSTPTRRAVDANTMEVLSELADAVIDVLEARRQHEEMQGSLVELTDGSASCAAPTSTWRPSPVRSAMTSRDRSPPC